MKPYIKNLEYKFFSNFGKNYLTVDYDRNGEHNHITYIVKKSISHNEKAVRNFLNS
jgi:hypothetical protein